MIYIDNIMIQLKRLKGLKTIDQLFEDDLLLVFLHTPEEDRRKLYNNILTYSIKCPNEKSLESFQLNMELFSQNSEARSYAIQINRNCKNNYYKCS